jgi:maleate isomerase
VEQQTTVQYLKGWRAEIGILTPAAGHEREWEVVAPKGVRFVRGLLGLTGNSKEELKEIFKQIETESIKINLPYKRDLICFHCTSGSFIEGPGYDQKIIEKIEKVSGSPGTTTTTCVLELLKDLGINRMVLVGPYKDEIFDIEVNFFAAYGIDAVYIKGSGLGLVKTSEFWNYAMDPYASYRLVKDGHRADGQADCIFVTCAASPLLGIADVLEKEIGKPVISSNSATLYGMLKKLKIPDPIFNYGEVLRKPRIF